MDVREIQITNKIQVLMIPPSKIPLLLLGPIFCLFLACSSISIQGTYLIKNSSLAMHFSGIYLTMFENNQIVFQAILDHADSNIWRYRITNVGDKWIYHNRYSIGDFFLMKYPTVDENHCSFEYTHKNGTFTYDLYPMHISAQNREGRLLYPNEVEAFELLSVPHTVEQRFYHNNYKQYHLEFHAQPSNLLTDYTLDSIFNPDSFDPGFFPSNLPTSHLEIQVYTISFPEGLEQDLKRAEPPASKPGMVQPKNQVKKVDFTDYLLPQEVELMGIGIETVKQPSYYEYARPKIFRFSYTSTLGAGLGSQYNLYPLETTLEIFDTPEKQIFGFYENIPMIGMKMVVLDSYPGYKENIAIQALTLYFKKQ